MPLQSFPAYSEMKTPFQLFAYLVLAAFVSCGNAGKGKHETKSVTDSIASDSLPETFFEFEDEQEKININDEWEYFIEQMLEEYELKINKIRTKYFINDKYTAPPGHLYHTDIHPAVEMYELLNSRHKEMTPEQLSRFRKLSKKIHEVF